MGNVCQPALRRRYKFSRRTAGRRSTRWVCGSRRRAMCMPWHKHHRLRPIDWCGARGRLSFSCRQHPLDAFVVVSFRLDARHAILWGRKEQMLGPGGCARVKFMRARLFGRPAGWGWYRWDTAQQRWAIGFLMKWASRRPCCANRRPWQAGERTGCLNLSVHLSAHSAGWLTQIDASGSISEFGLRLRQLTIREKRKIVCVCQNPKLHWWYRKILFPGFNVNFSNCPED